MNQTGRILIVDDEKNIRRTLSMILSSEGYEVVQAENGEIGLALAQKEDPFDLVLLDIWMPDMDGIQVLTELKEINSDIAVIMISGHGTIQTAVETLQKGATDFLEKPLSKEKTLVAIKNALEKSQLKQENRELRGKLERRYELLGESSQIKQLWQKIQRAAPSKGRILIQGENGTGKELIARAIHRLSTRADQPFVKVNCAAIPEELIESELFGHEKGAFTGATAKRIGKFEQADGGTIFLDEIGDMSLKTQAKVLRVLQESEIEHVGGNTTIKVDVRVISATNKNLEDEIKSDNFREDLFYRISVIPIYAPPLRNHKEDIPLYVHHFVKTFCEENGFRIKDVDDDAMDLLTKYDYPGNVRELQNLIERLVIMTSNDVITAKDLPDYISHHQATFRKNIAGNKTLKELKNEIEREYILAKLDENEWNISQTANVLGIERTNLYKKMKYYDIQTK